MRATFNTAGGFRSGYGSQGRFWRGVRVQCRGSALNDDRRRYTWRLGLRGSLMAIEDIQFSVCSSRLPRKEVFESREIAMGHLDAKIKKARDAGGSAGMLDNGRWGVHFSNQAVGPFWGGGLQGGGWGVGK